MRSSCLLVAAAGLAWLPFSACSSAPVHVVDRQTSKTCAHFDEPGDAWLLVPSGVTVARPRLVGWLHEAFSRHLPPEPCEGPVRVPVPSGTQVWIVYVKTSGEDVSFELQAKFARGGLYELRIVDTSGTITWDLLKVAQP